MRSLKMDAFVTLNIILLFKYYLKYKKIIYTKIVLLSYYVLIKIAKVLFAICKQFYAKF